LPRPGMEAARDNGRPFGAEPVQWKDARSGRFVAGANFILRR
jgi:hypothetical protein